LNDRVRNVLVRMILSIIIFIYISYLAWQSLPRFDFAVLMAFFAVFLGWSIIETFIYKDPDTQVELDADRRSYLYMQVSSLLVLFYALIDFLDYHFSRMNALEPWIILAGFLIFIGNAILRYNAITTLGKYYNPRVALYQEHSLVTGGIYQIIRHPMYLSAILNVIAIALVFSSWGALVIMLFTVLPAVIYRINIEEEFLLAHLGKEYQQYMEQSKRMIPGIW
jgi:protein-S-isoprenylcysteine O-methyltransferase Ste14